MAAADDFEGRVDRVEQKVDALGESVDARFDAVDARFDRLETSVDDRFDAVDHAFVEQRQYTEFAFEGLRTEMREGFDRIARKLDAFIDAQARTNAYTERRLRRLETPPV